MVLINGKKSHWIEKDGRVIGPNFMPVPQKKDKRGFRYVYIESERLYIHDLVLQSFGEPPAKSRPAEKGEVPNFIDNDRGNVHIDNLEWITEKELSKRKGSQKTLGEEGEELIWSMITGGSTYKQIREHFAKNEGLKITDPTIAKVKKKFTLPDTD